MAGAVAQTTSPEAPASRSFRIHSARPDGSSVRCTTDGEDILVPRVPASYLRSGDHVRVGSHSSPIGEYLATQNSLGRKARQLYFGHIGCVSQPRTDKRDEFFVRADVLESGLGIRALHLPNSAVKDYFYFFAPRDGETPQPTLYEALRTSRSATPADLRLSYRIRRIELETRDAARSEMQRIERAFNLLAHPDLRSCYDALLQNSALSRNSTGTAF